MPRVLKAGTTIIITLLVFFAVVTAVTVGIYFGTRKKSSPPIHTVPLIPLVPPESDELDPFGELHFVTLHRVDDSKVPICSSDARTTDVNKKFGRFVVNEDWTRLAMTDTWEPPTSTACKTDPVYGWDIANLTAHVVLPTPLMYKTDQFPWTQVTVNRWSEDTIGTTDGGNMPTLQKDGGTGKSNGHSMFGVVDNGVSRDDFPYSIALHPKGNVAVWAAWQADTQDFGTNKSDLHFYNYEQKQNTSQQGSGSQLSESYTLRGWYPHEKNFNQNFGKCMRFVTEHYLLVSSDGNDTDPNNQTGNVTIFPWPPDEDWTSGGEISAHMKILATVNPGQGQISKPSPRVADHFHCDDALQMLTFNSPDTGEICVFRVDVKSQTSEWIQTLQYGLHKKNFGFRVHVTDPLRFLIASYPDGDAFYTFLYDEKSKMFATHPYQIVKVPLLSSFGTKPASTLGFGANMAATKKGRAVVLTCNRQTADLEQNMVFVYRLDLDTNMFKVETILDPFKMPGAQAFGHCVATYYDEGVNTLFVLLANQKDGTILEFQSENQISDSALTEDPHLLV